jgi:hypothetical protein
LRTGNFSPENLRVSKLVRFRESVDRKQVYYASNPPSPKILLPSWERDFEARLPFSQIWEKGWGMRASKGFGMY